MKKTAEKKATSFKTGDAVMAKGGGPRMTVSEDHDGRGEVSCVWFMGSPEAWGEVRNGTFPEGTLQRLAA